MSTKINNQMIVTITSKLEKSTKFALPARNPPILVLRVVRAHSSLVGIECVWGVMRVRVPSVDH